MLDKEAENRLDRIWAIIEKVRVCMLTTQFAGGLRARPLEARPDRDAGRLLFVTDVHSAKEHDVQAAPNVALAFIDPADKAYLSITGHARAVRDAETTSAVWTRTNSLWWRGGPTDRNVCLLVVEPLVAELWDGPASQAVTIFEFARAIVTGKTPRLGENRKVTIDM